MNPFFSPHRIAACRTNPIWFGALCGRLVRHESSFSVGEQDEKEDEEEEDEEDEEDEDEEERRKGEGVVKKTDTATW